MERCLDSAMNSCGFVCLQHAGQPADMPQPSATLSEVIPDIAMPTSSLPSSLRRMRLHDSAAGPSAIRPMMTYNLQPAASSFYPRDDDVDRRSYFMPHGSVLASTNRSNPPPVVEQGLDLDLGDGASHSGSRGSTFERRSRNSNSLYI